MHMAMDHQPAVPLRVGAGAIKRPRFLGQSSQELRIVIGCLFHGQNHARRDGQPIGKHGHSARPALGGALTLLAGLVLLSLPGPALAQAASSNQPEAIQPGGGLTPSPCPRIGPPGTIQPLRIQPQLVKAKNARGCLSAEDALYAPNGCPMRFCGARTPRLQLPPP
jgi:hypothetical protein